MQAPKFIRVRVAIENGKPLKLGFFLQRQS